MLSRIFRFRKVFKDIDCESTVMVARWAVLVELVLSSLSGRRLCFFSLTETFMCYCCSHLYSAGHLFAGLIISDYGDIQIFVLLCSAFCAAIYLPGAIHLVHFGILIFSHSEAADLYLFSRVNIVFIYLPLSLVTDFISSCITSLFLHKINGTGSQMQPKISLLNTIVSYDIERSQLSSL